MSKSESIPSEAVKTSEGRQYHINLAPGELVQLGVDPYLVRALIAQLPECLAR